ncbi:hypothetical protein J2S09_000462 [Bacillus fengqiuensis]|nr:hypothetical protein [Bacillus fengqiuensis]
MPIAGIVQAVDCDTVLLTAPGGTLTPILTGVTPIAVIGSARFSLCDISAVFRLGS